MIASMFSLDARLAELRPSDAQQRLARQRREAAMARPQAGVHEPSGPAARAGGSLAGPLGGQPSHAIAR